MVVAIAVICLFLLVLFVLIVDVEALWGLEDENRIKDREMTEEIIQALRDTKILKKYETINEDILQPYARRLWKTDCPAEQIQIGMEVADAVTEHTEIVEIDPVLHRRSQFTLIVNKKLC